jgi:hypothetical protein
MIRSTVKKVFGYDQRYRTPSQLVSFTGAALFDRTYNQASSLLGVADISSRSAASPTATTT